MTKVKIYYFYLNFISGDVKKVLTLNEFYAMITREIENPRISTLGGV